MNLFMVNPKRRVARERISMPSTIMKEDTNSDSCTLFKMTMPKITFQHPKI